jgi:hypothetical protein
VVLPSCPKRRKLDPDVFETVVVQLSVDSKNNYKKKKGKKSSASTSVTPKSSSKSKISSSKKSESSKKKSSSKRKRSDSYETDSDEDYNPSDSDASPLPEDEEEEIEVQPKKKRRSAEASKSLVAKVLDNESDSVEEEMQESAPAQVIHDHHHHQHVVQTDGVDQSVDEIMADCLPASFVRPGVQKRTTPTNVVVAPIITAAPVQHPPLTHQQIHNQPYQVVNVNEMMSQQPMRSQQPPVQHQQHLPVQQQSLPAPQKPVASYYYERVPISEEQKQKMRQAYLEDLWKNTDEDDKALMATLHKIAMLRQQDEHQAVDVSPMLPFDQALLSRYFQIEDPSMSHYLYYY